MMELFNLQTSRMDKEKQLDRMVLIVTGAQEMFLRSGYGRTPMAEIAKHVGMAPGTMYNYFTNKEALFDFVVRQQILRLTPDEWPEIPVPSPPPGAILSFMKTHSKRIARIPSLMNALQQTDCPDPEAELKGIMEDYYDINTRYRILLIMVIKSAWDWPELSDLYYRDIVSELQRSFKRYLRIRTKQQHFRKLPNLDASVRVIWESLSWFARSRPHVPYAKKMSEKAARETAIEALLRVFIPDH